MYPLDPHIFADSDPDLESQNVTDPDPKQCFCVEMEVDFSVENFSQTYSPHFCRELEGWLANVGQPSISARAVISPHAGYRYSGATAAHSFKQINPENVR